ncbi:MAG: ArsC/Spx/MgsR family protein [Bdellovibrionota bacterium]
MSITIYHNPRCSKSREALALLKEQGASLTIIEYLSSPPSETELLEILGIFAGDISEIVRTKEEKYLALDFDLSTKESIAKNLGLHPELMERPLIVCDGMAFVARPIEKLKKIL